MKPCAIRCDNLRQIFRNHSRVSDLGQLVMSNNPSNLTTSAQPAPGGESKFADTVINALGYTKTRVISSGAPSFTTFFFQPGAIAWDFSTAGVGTLSNVPVCSDVNMTVDCVTRAGVINGTYAGYRNWNNTNDHAFVLNHPNGIGFAGRAPYASDYGVSATVRVSVDRMIAIRDKPNVSFHCHNPRSATRLPIRLPRHGAWGDSRPRDSDAIKCPHASTAQSSTHDRRLGLLRSRAHFRYQRRLSSELTLVDGAAPGQT